jgi:hypothetical protein
MKTLALSILVHIGHLEYVLQFFHGKLFTLQYPVFKWIESFIHMNMKQDYQNMEQLHKQSMFKMNFICIKYSLYAGDPILRMVSYIMKSVFITKLNLFCFCFFLYF